jgi:dienelactone hydrolase
MKTAIIKALIGVLGVLLLLAALATGCGSAVPEEDGDADVPTYERPDLNDGDLIADGDLQPDGDILPDGDVTPDGDTLVDGDSALDGDGMSDGDVATDGDLISDGDDAVDGDNAVDGDEDRELPQGFCRGWEDCPEPMVCHLSLGRCERRSSVPEQAVEIYHFSPREATGGDRLIIDGARFFFSMAGSFSVHVAIGGQEVPFGSYQTDENRIIVDIPTGASGVITVTGEDVFPVSSRDALISANPGVIECDGTTPDATELNPLSVDDIGPYAAGFVDTIQDDMRLFYPARCGSVRRPAVTGTYPLIVILHGNGALALNYEYLADYLASWGFVVAMVATISENENDPETISGIITRVSPLISTELSGYHSVLTNVQTDGRVAFVGHSRGCARTQATYQTNPEIEAASVATMFLGPAGADYETPGAFIVFGAELDGQSFSWDTNNAYDMQGAPRWKIWVKGGNHGLFADHKVYHMFDGTPQITRRQELMAVTRFAIPFMQRAFQMDEPFSEWLDNPPEMDYLEVTADVGR